MRRFLACAALSYRSLMNWLRPPNLVGSKLLNPLCQVVLFVLIVRASGGTGLTAPQVVASNGVVLTSFGGVYGLSICLSQARASGILPYFAVAPVSRTWLLASMAFFNVIDGILTGLLVIAVGLPAVGASLKSFPLLFCIVIVAALSAAALGLLTSALSLTFRDQVGVGMNVVFFLTLLLSGAEVPTGSLPPGFAQLSAVWPLSHAVAAARVAVLSQTGHAWPDIAAEAGVAVVVSLAAVIFTRATERFARATGRNHVFG
jgi:ABC-type polysaccharide/polyol phosphate export permease